MAQTLRAAELWPSAAERLPTLTEVVELVHATAVSDSGPDTEVPAIASAEVQAALRLSAEVLFELEQRVDTVFEARLREALAPALARAADALIRDARQELAGALRVMVEDAVTQALERRTHL